MIALFFLFLALSASPFKSKNRLAAENAALRHHGRDNEQVHGGDVRCVVTQEGALASICSMSSSSFGWPAETWSGSMLHLIRPRNGLHARSRRHSLGMRLRAT